MTAFGGKSLGTKTHEKVGEEFLQKLGFPKSVTDFVRGHVSAKRYLVFKYDFFIFLFLFKNELLDKIWIFRIV